jgi:uncharacterized protein YprB with RNaseH-like and TPR domain/predicted RNA-binding Zn-ribbon protein involved in translation (DUF1610 family)
MKTDAKILFLDIETAPSLGWVWQKWQTNVIDFQRDWYMLSFAYKWAGERKVTVHGLIDYKACFNADMEDDSVLVDELWKQIDAADIIVAHNGDSFDLVKINTRFLIHGLKPPSPYRTVDTLKIARKVFAFDSNKLDDLGHYLNIGRKLPHTGFHLWKGCMSGDPKSWAMMKRYNAHDIELLEKLYYLIREWAPTHPNVNQGSTGNCPRCGSEKVQRRGFTYTALRKKQRYQCVKCNGWFEGSAVKI